MQVYRNVLRDARTMREEALMMRIADREDQENKQVLLAVADALHDVCAEMEQTEEINPTLTDRVSSTATDTATLLEFKN